ncbi:MAG TPA: TRAM domain-containing protein [Chthoniobacteraceae bacterium]|nr:TRAM domain-containing protein [Chthoniobacteraceae bacterium]
MKTLELEITDVAFGGNGVARHDGKVYFVPFTIPGEKVVARVVREKKKFGEAELISVTHESPDRVAPECPYFERCGGCSYQHIAYARQLEIKTRQVAEILRRVGRISHIPMRDIIPAPAPYGYRNRIRVHRAAGITGFFAHGAQALIDIEQCPISMPEVNAALRRLRMSPVGDGDYSLRAPGGGGPFFEQTNAEVARAMVTFVAANLRRGQALLVDGFCGSGLFAAQLAELFVQTIGIEQNEFAIAQARRHGTTRERYIAGTVEEHLGDILQGHDPNLTTVLLDPPATGISPRLLDILSGTPVSELVYVSCNPATLARDLAGLAGAFELTSVTPVDMFPQTAEIEVVAVLRRASPPPR